MKETWKILKVIFWYLIKTILTSTGLFFTVLILTFLNNLISSHFYRIDFDLLNEITLVVGAAMALTCTYNINGEKWNNKGGELKIWDDNDPRLKD